MRERIYVQTDKHLYLAGEPILMKFVTTDSELIPLAFSRVAYAELVNDSVSLVQMMVELNNGVGTGRMVLPVDLPTGYYRLIAYTNFMRNEGAGVFFEKNIAVVNTFLSGYNLLEARTEAARHFSPVEECDAGTVSLQTDAAIYTTRTRGELTISGLPENIHTLSVSIAGKDFVPAAHSGASLFRNNRMKQSVGFSGKFIPEYEGHIITGRIIDNQTESPATIAGTIATPAIAFPGEGVRFFPGQTSETGDVRFFTSGISGTREVATVVFNAGEQYRIDVLSPFVSQHAARQMPTLQIDTVYYSQLLERSVALQVFRFFADDNLENRNVSTPHMILKPSRSFPLDEFTRFTTMGEVFIEFIPGARFRRNAIGNREMQILTRRGSHFEFGMPLVLLDGVPVLDHEAIFNYDPLLVEIINLYYGPFSMGGLRFDGIIEFLTYRRLHQNLNLNRATQVISYVGPQMPYRFHTPDYSEGDIRQRRMPDARHTLLWKPDITTNGKTSITIPFDTSDLTGEFQATVEGITKDGKFISATAFFKVEQ